MPNETRVNGGDFKSFVILAQRTLLPPSPHLGEGQVLMNNFNVSETFFDIFFILQKLNLQGAHFQIINIGRKNVIEYAYCLQL